MKTYYLLLITAWLAKWVPARVGYWVCSFVGGIVFYLRPSIRHNIMGNMKHVLPKSSVHQRRAIACTGLRAS